MKKKLIIISIMLFVFSTINAQFQSVKDGNWNDPLTWSTNSEATALPDSTTSVIISHRVTVQGQFNINYNPECYNLTVDTNGVLINYTSAYTTGDIKVYNNFINHGTFSPSYDMTLTIKGNFINYGYFFRNASTGYLSINCYGDVTNLGSFRVDAGYGYGIKFYGDIPHHIRTYNDSTIYITGINIDDTQGYIIVDSLASISAYTQLNTSKIVMPTNTVYPNTLELVGGQIVGGEIIANGNTIQTKSVTILGDIRGDANNLLIKDAILEGYYRSGGQKGNYNGTSLVIFEGETVLNGTIENVFSNSTLYSDYRGIIIDGNFTNNGYIQNNAGGDNLSINIMNSNFISTREIDAYGIKFYENCEFSTTDSIAVEYFEAVDSNTTVTITSGNLIFKDKTVDVNFNGGKLILPSNSLFYTTLEWYNKLRNIYVEANNSEISFLHVAENVTTNNAQLSYYTFATNSTLTGDIKIVENGTLIAYSNSNPHVNIKDDFENYGIIRNHYSSGSLYLTFEGNILHDGRSWENLETKLIGTEDQNIIIPNDSSWSGKVIFDPMLEASSYVWMKDGVEIPGATSKELVFNNGLSTSDYGEYYCIVGFYNSRKIFIGNKLPNAFEITDVKITNLNATQTQIDWKTTKPASGFVFYAKEDTSSGFPYEAMETNGNVLEHTIILDTLTTGATYYFIIDQNDADWNNIRSGTYSFVAGESESGGSTPFDTALATLKKLPNVPDEAGTAYYDGAFLSKNIAYVVTSHNRLFKTTDGGDSWIDISPEQGTSFDGLGVTPRVSFYNENIGAVAFSLDDGANGYDYSKVFGYVWCTIDGGQTWSQRFDVNEDQILHLEQVSETVLYVSGPAHYGVSSNRWFKKITRDISSNAYTVSDITPTPQERPHVKSGDWLNDSTGVIIGRLNVQPYSISIYKTTDGGTSWENINGNLPAIDLAQISFSDRGIKMIDEDTFIFAYYNPVGDGYDTKIWATEDGGTTWFETPIQDSPVILNSLSIDQSADYGLICGYHTDTSIGFYVMYTEGNAWQSYLLPDIETETWLYATELCSDGTIWVIGSKNSIWKSDATQTDLRGNINEEIPSKYTLSQNYPNPFNPSTVIDFALPTTGNVSLKVYNSIGEEVATLVNREMNAGYHSISFDANGLSSGIYFYRIILGNFMQTKKMILLR